jgi:hypothetical protein
MVPMKPNAVLLALLSVVLVSTLPRYAHAQVLTNEALSADRIAIYHQFFASDPAFANIDEVSNLDVSNVTEAFHYKSYVDVDRYCLANAYIFDITTASLHKLPAQSFTSGRIHLIDLYSPEARPDTSLVPILFHHAAVDTPLTAHPDTLITLSEIVFDDTHTHAAFRYTLATGPNSAKGATVLYEFTNGSWKPSSSTCSEWAR